MAERDVRDGLRADCERCQGLCCIIPGYAASSEFAVAKPAGRPCRHLTAQGRCDIHDALRVRGFPGCTAYDCFGAGQRLCADGGPPDFDAFLPLVGVHELLWYLTDAAERELPQALSVEVSEATEQVLAVAADVVRLPELDVAGLRARVAPVLRRVSEAVRRGSLLPVQDRAGADLAGRALSGVDLSAACLRGASLVGADLREADLRFADLLGADLRGADLCGADLGDALFCTQTQLGGALGDAATHLPGWMRRPSHWSESDLPALPASAIAGRGTALRPT